MKASAIQVHWHSEDSPIYSAHIEPHGKGRLATAGGDNCVRLWQLQHSTTGEVPNVTYLATLARHTQAVNVVRFSPKGEILASAGDDGNVLLWVPCEPKEVGLGDDQLGIEREHWRVKSMCRSSTGSEIYDLAWSPDGNYLITGSMDNIARIYDARDGQCVRQIAEHNHYVQGVAWDPVNEYVATQSSDRSLNVYNLKRTDGQLMLSNTQSSSKHALPNHVSRVGRSQSPMRDGRSLSSSGNAHTVVIPNTSAYHDTAAVASPSPSAPGTPVHFPLPMRPPAITPSRRSSFEASASNRGRSLSPAPGVPLPAVKPLVSGITGSPSTGQLKLRPFHLYHDEAMPSFFRRLTFTPDGSFLLAPAGQYKQVGEHLSKDEEMLNTIYIYSRAGLSRPPVAHLPNQRKAAVAIRCSPALFQLRNKVRPTLRATLDTSSGENFGDLPPSQAVPPGTPKPPALEVQESETAADGENTVTRPEDSKTVPNAIEGAKGAFSLPYRVVYAVATQDAVSIYDTQQLTPIAVLSNLHYATFTDLAWSTDGLTLIMTSTDGYCSACVFSREELGEVYDGPWAIHLNRGENSTAAGQKGAAPRSSGSIAVGGVPNLDDPLHRSTTAAMSAAAQQQYKSEFQIPTAAYSSTVGPAGRASPARSDSNASNASFATAAGPVHGLPSAILTGPATNLSAPAAGVARDALTMANLPPGMPLQTPPMTPASVAGSTTSSADLAILAPTIVAPPITAVPASTKRSQPTEASAAAASVGAAGGVSEKAAKKRRIQPTLVSTGAVTVSTESKADAGAGAGADAGVPKDAA